MLLELKVKDFGIIEDINWKLEEGFNVITGETGAGKSLVIDAVELLLIGASSEDVIRSGAAEAMIEGVFNFSDNKRYSSIINLLDDKGLTPGDNVLIIGCEVRRRKPSLIRINGHTVTKTLLKQIGQLLIDIHGQSEHLSLLDKKYHLDFLDAYAQNIQRRNIFHDKVSRFNDLTSMIKMLKEKEQESNRQEDFLKYQIDEIQKAELKEGEDEELEKERQLISFSEKLKEHSTRVYQSLYGGEGSDSSDTALLKLNEALEAMNKLVELDSKLAQQRDFIEKAAYGIEEIARDIRSYGDTLENDPRRIEEIETRLQLIANLKRKYGKTISDILIYSDKAESELAGISQSSEKRVQMEGELYELAKELGVIASEISRERSNAAKKLMNDVRKELNDLDMSQTVFEVCVTQKTSDTGIEGKDGKTYEFNSEGIDDVEFRVSTNPGEPLKPLAKIASTGEVSRFTLALKGALSEADSIPILIFDEIDIGVGGRSGDIIGKKLWNLSRNHQVICVTHLPQIAAYANAHFMVNKQVDGQHTTSTLARLAGNARVEELAIMLFGREYSEIAIKNARELTQKAESWKKSNS